MAHVSVIGSGTMGHAIADVVTRGGNTVEVLGHRRPRQARHRRHRRPCRPLRGSFRRPRHAWRTARGQGRRRHHQPAELRDLRRAHRAGRQLRRRGDRGFAAPTPGWSRPSTPRSPRRWRPARSATCTRPSSSPVTTPTPESLLVTCSPRAACAPWTPGAAPGPRTRGPGLPADHSGRAATRSPGPADSLSSPDTPQPGASPSAGYP